MFNTSFAVVTDFYEGHFT